MSKSSVITIRIDPDVKSRLEKLYASFGLNISDAINMFIHQSLLVKGLPFELRNPGFRGEMSIDDGTFSEEPVELSIEELKAIVAPIAEKYGLRYLALVGSRARGDNRPDSDYDFCYEMKEPSLLKAAGLMADLSDAVGTKVDLISRVAASGDLLDNITKDGVIIYEG